MKLKKFSKKMQKKLSGTFKCGNEYLDKFLKSTESLDTKFGKTYVYLNDKEDSIISYFNVGTGSLIEKNYIKEKGENYIHDMKVGGSAHLNCFALDINYQGKILKIDKISIKFSDYLLSRCIKKILEIKHKHIGFSFITLYSTKKGYNLYKRFGFEDIEDDMMLPLENSEKNCYPMYFPILEL